MKVKDGVAWGVVDAVGHIVLQRPEKANALNFALLSALAGAIDEVIALAPRVVLLSAQGSVFCAGGDIGWMLAAGKNFHVEVDRTLEVANPALYRLATGPIPVVSAVSGPVGGAGIALALCADFVLGATSMKLRTGYSALGVTPDLGVSYFLSRRIGAVRAKQWLMLSESVNAEDCLKAGVVDALYPVDALAAAAEALVKRLACSAPGSLGGIKKLCNALQAGELLAQLNLERQILSDCARRSDFQEGVRAFTEKRLPAFTGS
ncbi:MAG: enoyl-CoA hydratase/isomerase family protein [Rhodoferax sp.]|nr:enoyl-CoA hydratase/isomerase family protein [Rhodoferax sp.]